jgi:hypothetical protein
MIGNAVAGLLGGGVPPVLATAYESIATNTVGSGGTTSVTFGSIPSTFTHLQIRYIARNASLANNTIIRFNGDSSTNYSTHYLIGNGSTASAGAETSSTYIYTDILSQTTTSFSPTIVDILDYANTNKYKTARSLSGIDMNGSGTIWSASGAWRSTAAITSITFSMPAGFNFAEYTQFALYGIKGS